MKFFHFSTRLLTIKWFWQSIVQRIIEQGFWVHSSMQRKDSNKYMQSKVYHSCINYSKLQCMIQDPRFAWVHSARLDLTLSSLNNKLVQIAGTNAAISTRVDQPFLQRLVQIMTHLSRCERSRSRTSVINKILYFYIILDTV